MGQETKQEIWLIGCFKILSMNNFTVIWRNVEIDFENPIPDMWYLEGEWKPDSTTEAKAFTSLVNKFDAASVMKDWKNGTLVL